MLECRSTDVEAGDMGSINLQGAGPDVSVYIEMRAAQERKHLIVREDAEVNVPVLDVDLAMWGICHAVD